MLAFVELKKKVLFFVLVAFFSGVWFDYSFSYKFDNWLYDSAIVYQKRTDWKHSGIVVLDNDVPFSVGRKQALPLFAKATERLVEAGAKGVFLDARVPKELEGRMPYARCIELDGTVRWSMPQCNISTEQQCNISSSELGLSPLTMSNKAIQYFRLAPYLNNDSDLPDFLLFGWDAAEVIPKQGIVVSDRLVTFDSPIARWIDLTEDHAVYKLIEYIEPDKIQTLYQPQYFDELCNERYNCRRIRLSQPIYDIRLKGKQLILPVSVLASCDVDSALKMAALLKDKVVILQTSAPNESTDLVVTPMTTALFGPQLMTLGSQFLIDEVETLLNQDAPQPPVYWIKILLFLCIALLSVFSAINLRQAMLWLIATILFVTLVSLCLFNPVIQLWPVMAAMLVYFIGTGQVITIQLIVGAKEGELLRRYIPKQVRNVLMPLRKNESFKDTRGHVVVLMSDLAGYTTVTGLLKEPNLVLDLMNDYLNETSYVLQQKYDGILEAYVGDMVCYYWLADDSSTKVETYCKALLGGIELLALQKAFFISLQKRYKDKIDKESLQQIVNIIDAGIGITAGDVVRGDLGPKNGIKKFGILGDPLNLAARIEGLTRFFNTEIIIASDLLTAIDKSGLVVRRLGVFKVKGRVLPETLYALGSVNEERFSEENIKQWDLWLESVEPGIEKLSGCPECYSKDEKTINNWLKRDLLKDDGVWYLDEK